MKKILKIAGITVGVILILLLVLPFAFQGKIEQLVKQEGNKMLNAQFDFGALNISLLRNFPSASVTLEDFYLKGAGAFENDTLIQAGELTAAVNLLSLFGDSGYDKSAKTTNCPQSLFCFFNEGNSSLYHARVWVCAHTA